VTPDFNLCDVCGAKVPPTDRFFIATDREYNGIENETVGKHLDLCGKHLTQVIEILCYGPTGRIADYEMGKKAVAAVESLKRKK